MIGIKEYNYVTCSGATISFAGSHSVFPDFMRKRSYSPCSDDGRLQNQLS